ncbi:Erg28-like protein [Terfezia boudieri ATCC MYA-4762]|uniref:Erg28-like protein n=1 Tax=Terfezia boudieri ATCC MYA-4762 TaxID=1051890 RepID=A0A3N4LUV3_9PEZI|nr:Erg28-like protein [Terfezia boudieri ATCC MYA-4762]
MDTLLSLLPGPGLLPKWLLLVSTIAIGNSIQSYLTLSYTKRVYALGGDKVTPLSSRTFGTWTFLAALIRFYTAYHITNPECYALCQWSYFLAFAHFFSEWLVFKTAVLNEGLIGPVVVSTISMAWMWAVKGEYLGL